MNKKYLYLLGLFAIGLLAFVVVPSYAMFQDGYVSNEDIVGINLSFNLIWV